jgi:5'-nucleotidase
MSKSKETVLVDMDGVAADFDAMVIEEVEAYSPGATSAMIRSRFYIADDLPEHAELIRDVQSREGFFADLPLIDGVLEGWQRIIDLGYDPRICSSPLSINKFCERDKLVWLGKHFAPIFGASVVERAIITKNKHEFDGKVLIDDRPEIRLANSAKWRHLVFDRPYNQESGDFRLRGWRDDRLEELLSR